MDNLHLFALINAGPGLAGFRLAVAVVLAEWLIYSVPLVMVIAWVRGDRAVRWALLHLLLAALVSLCVAQVVAHLWPQPRPFALHLGTQYLEHGNDPGMPSDHVTVLWSLALASFGVRRYEVWGLPLLAAGMMVGCSRVYLGVHFPFDVLAALPVAALGTVGARALEGPRLPVVSWLLNLYDQLSLRGFSMLRAARKAWARRV